MTTHAAHVAAALERAERGAGQDLDAGTSAPPLEPGRDGGSATPILDLVHALLGAAITVQSAGKGLRARLRIRHDGIANQILTLIEALLDETSEMTPHEFAGSAAIAIANALPIIQPIDGRQAQRLDDLRRTLTAASRSHVAGRGG